MASFLDTNVLVYAVDASVPRKRAAALAILEDEARHLVVSAQVLEEFYWTVTRKLRPPMPADEAQAMVRELTRATDVVAVDASLVEDAIDLAQRTPLALWDAAIVITAERGGCSAWLTEDLNDGQEIEGVLVRDPFMGT